MPARDQLKSVAYTIACPVCEVGVGARCMTVRKYDLGSRRKAGSLSYQAHTERLRVAREKAPSENP